MYICISKLTSKPISTKLNKIQGNILLQKLLLDEGTFGALEGSIWSSSEGWVYLEL
jgi:hypothetical protein